jgi:hypothetical protein
LKEGKAEDAETAGCGAWDAEQGRESWRLEEDLPCGPRVAVKEGRGGRSGPPGVLVRKKWWAGGKEPGRARTSWAGRRREVGLGGGGKRRAGPWARKRKREGKRVWEGFFHLNFFKSFCFNPFQTFQTLNSFQIIQKFSKTI